MNQKSKGNQSLDKVKYHGHLRIPGTPEEAEIIFTVGFDSKSVKLDFPHPVATNSKWQIGSVTVRRLLKYDEVHFVTTGLPIEGVDLQWKTNCAKSDNTLAGVIIAKPNKHKVVGEIGFSLVQISGK